jgi:hypothetical protein
MGPSESRPILVCRQEAFVPAPVGSVWALVGHPARHPEWWAEIVQVEGQGFGQGCCYCQVSRAEGGTVETNFVVERVEDLKELRVRCEETGLYMRWLLAEAQGGTFVDAEFGFDAGRAAEAPPEERAKSAQMLRTWLHTSLGGLREAAALEVPGEVRARGPSPGSPS